MTDPDRAVAGAHEDGTVATRDDRAGFGVRAPAPHGPRWASKTATGAPHRTGEHPGCAIGGTDAAQHVLGGSAQWKPRSTWRTGVAVRPRTPGRCSPAAPARIRGRSPCPPPRAPTPWRRRSPARCRACSCAAVRAAREGAGRPDRTGVHLLHRLQGGDPPDGLGVHDRPVQGRRAAVALRTGWITIVGRRPDLGGHAFAQERADHQVGSVAAIAARSSSSPPAGARPCARPRAARSSPLGQAVERRTEQHDPHQLPLVPRAMAWAAGSAAAVEGSGLARRRNRSLATTWPACLGW